MRTSPMASRPVASPSTRPVSTTPSGAPLGRISPASNQAPRTAMATATTRRTRPWCTHRAGATGGGEHARREGVGGQVGSGHVDAERQEIHLVVEDVGQGGRLLAGPHDLEGGVAQRAPQALHRAQEADAERPAPLVLLVELAEDVDVDQRRPGDDPLGLVALLL